MSNNTTPPYPPQPNVKYTRFIKIKCLLEMLTQVAKSTISLHYIL